MNDYLEGLSCTAKCWGAAILGGILIAILLMALAGFSFLGALFLAAIIGVIGGFILTKKFCDAQSGAHQTDAATPASTPTASTQPAAASPAASTATASGGATSSATAAGVMSTQTAPASAAPKKAAPKKTAAPKAAAKTPAAKTAAPKKTAAKSTASKTAKAAGDTKTAAATPARKPVAKDGKPATMKTARKSGADDLKLIKGVGPGLEKTLNELGFWHFDQIAGWRKKEIEWVDERLKFKGRIERDEWVKQAKALAKGR